MIKSDFIRDIVELILDSPDINIYVRNSILDVSNIEYEYTGGGVFVSFGGSEFNIPEAFQLTGIFDGLMIDSPEIEFGAEATIRIQAGRIDSLEIWCHAGEYPRTDLSKYLLRQEWKGSPEKTLSRL